MSCLEDFKGVMGKKKAKKPQGVRLNQTSKGNDFYCSSKLKSHWERMEGWSVDDYRLILKWNRP